MTKLTVIDGGGRGRPTALRDRRASQCIVLDRAMRNLLEQAIECVTMTGPSASLLLNRLFTALGLSTPPCPLRTEN